MPFVTDRTLFYGCVFCKTGCEIETVSQLTENIQAADFVVPRKTIRRRTENGMIEDTEILFPGYLFFQTTSDVPLMPIKQNRNVLKVLTPDKNDWRLSGSDAMFVKWIFDHNGMFGLSEAHFIGDRIHIIAGPLQGMDGMIKKINRRFRTCQVCVNFNGFEFHIWLGYKLVNDVHLPVECS